MVSEKVKIGGVDRTLRWTLANEIRLGEVQDVLLGSSPKTQEMMVAWAMLDEDKPKEAEYMAMVKKLSSEEHTALVAAADRVWEASHPTEEEPEEAEEIEPGKPESDDSPTPSTDPSPSSESTADAPSKNG